MEVRSLSRPGALPWEKYLGYPMARGLGGPQCRPWCLGGKHSNYFALPGIEFRLLSCTVRNLVGFKTQILFMNHLKQNGYYIERLHQHYIYYALCLLCNLPTRWIEVFFSDSPSWAAIIAPEVTKKFVPFNGVCQHTLWCRKWAKYSSTLLRGPG
jgi:hypothetical protein